MARNWIAARFYELNMDASRNMYGHFTHMDDPALARGTFTHASHS